MRRLAVTLTLGLALSLLAPAAARADDDDPLGPLGPLVPGTAFGVLDPVITVLPPFPVPHTPYVGNVCPGGEDACIDDVVTEMKSRLAGLAAACDHDAVFSLAYLRVTENVRDAARSGYFQDRKWLTQVDAVFAELYFEVRDDWHAGRRAEVPQAWTIALRAEDDKAMTGLGNFMLAMNAHINRDFPHVLTEVGLTAPDGTSHRPDHNAYNQRLDSLYAPVFAEEAERFDPQFDDIDISTLEETAAGVIMRAWREGVWRHAEELALAKTPSARRLVERQIEVYAATQALLMRSIFTSGDAGTAERDAWCAERHG